MPARVCCRGALTRAHEHRLTGNVSLQVEDMLKRSFLEFHAQKAAPEALIAVEKGHAALARLRARTWPVSAAGATRAEVEQYCEMSARIEELSAELQVRRPD